MKSMHHRGLCLTLIVMILCTFTAAAFADVALPDEAWLQDNLRTVLVTAEGAVNAEAVELTPAQEDAAVLTSQPVPALQEGEWRVTVNLIGTEDGWTLDTAAPLTLTEAAAVTEDDAEEQPEETVEAPDAEAVAALVSLAGLCAHGETALEDVEAEVAAYTAEDGTVRATVTVTPDQAAAAAEKALGEPHAAGNLAELACEYTLEAVEDGFVLTGMKVVFPLVCGDALAAQEGDAEDDEAEQVRRYTVIYDDGAKGEAFAAERYRVRENKATPACKVDVSDPDAVREGYRFLGWEPEVAKTVTKDVTYTAQWVKLYTVTYEDGAEGEAFPAEQTVLPKGSDTPACTVDVSDPDALREGYRFLGWAPEVADTVTADVTYTAQWGKYFTVSYDNVPEGTENPNPTWCNEADLPIALEALDCDGFLGWLDADGNAVSEIPAGTCEDITLTANIVSRPAYPKDGTNIADGLYHIQCTTCEDHQMTHQAFLYVNTSRPTNNDLHWNAEAERWEITAEVQFNRFINSSTTRKNYFGNMTHHWDLGTGADKNPKIQLYWAPDAEGFTATGKPVTGLWYGVNGHPTEYEVFCYDRPAAPKAANVAKLSGSFYRFQDFTKPSAFSKVTRLSADHLTLGEVYGDAATGFYVDVTVDVDYYAADFLAKKCTDGADYVMEPAISNTRADWKLKYTGNATDYKQDGSGWTVDATIGGPNYATNAEKLNGRYINYYPTWQTTYTDGVEDEELFADETWTSPASLLYDTYNNGGYYNTRQKGIGTMPTTPFHNDAAAVPEREGYTFLGWEPAWSQYVSAHVTYTAQWERTKCTVTYWDGDKELAIFSAQEYDCYWGDETPAFQGTPQRDGYVFAGWSPEVADTVTGDVMYAAQWKKLCTVTYADGADGAVFQSVVFTDVLEGSDTPACTVDVSDPDALREGYRFLGWAPEVADTVADDVTYTAQWGKYFTVTYENVPDGTENPNPTRCNEGDTPIALQDLACDGFLTWVDADGNAVSEIPAGTCGDIILTASIVPRPAYPKDGTNIASGLYHIQCTTCEDHQMTHQAFLYVNTTRPTNNDLHWNAAAKRWEITADVQFNRFINSSTTRKNYFGNMTHHWDLGTGADKNPKIQLYWAPNAEGTTSTGKPVTGLWYGVNGHPTEYEVFCYDKPAAPTEAKIKAMSVKLFWLRDWTNVTHFKKVTKLIDDTYTVGEMTGDKDSGFYVPLTITNMELYYAVFRADYGDNFAFDPINSETVPTIYLKYSGSATDFKQDGSGWTVDYSNYPSKTAQGNGIALYFYPQWTTVYEDGVDGAAFATQTFVTPASMEGIPQDCLRYNANCFTTPAFTGEPVREGYLFTGWTPEVSTALTASVTYTATWEKACTVTYTDGADGAVFANETHTVSEGADTPAFTGSTERAGYRFDGWSPALAEKVAGDVTYTAQWTKVWTVTYTDGEEDETIFADQTYVVEDGAATPAYAGTINRPGYLFKGWTPGLDKTVTKDVVYTAIWTVDTVGLSVPAEPAATNGSSSDSSAPADQGNAPADQGNAPADEGNTPTDQGNAPADEGNAPADDPKEPLASSSDLT